MMTIVMRMTVFFFSAACYQKRSRTAILSYYKHKLPRTEGVAGINNLALGTHAEHQGLLK